MAEPAPPTFPTLVQRFFMDHLREQRAVSSQTIAAYRDTLRLLLTYVAAALRRTPSAITLPDLDAPMLLAFLDHLEKERGNSVRSRNARLAAIRTFLKFASHHDLSALATIERALAICSSGSIGQWSAFCLVSRSAPSSKPLIRPVGPDNATGHFSA